MYKQLTHNELEQLIQDCENLVVADVRDQESYDEAHIKAAIHLSMPMLQEFCDDSDKGQPITVYCFHGVSSQSVAQHLIEQGFTEVYSLIGGFETWKEYHPTSADASH